MPPVEPLIYRLYEIVQNYGYAYKAVINEKFGDGIMSAIAYSTKVEKETDKDGVVWVNITMRGKWSVQSMYANEGAELTHMQAAVHEILDAAYRFTVNKRTMVSTNQRSLALPVVLWIQGAS